MEALKADVRAKALAYLNETETDIEEFPQSIVDFVVEYAIEMSHFPRHFTDDSIANALTRCASTLAMACLEVYSKAGAEGQLSHSENGISRGYQTSWITPNLISALPNYVNTPSTVRI